MTPTEKLQRAITAAENDHYNPTTVYLDIETAKALLPNYGQAKPNPMSFYDFIPSDGTHSTQRVMFRRSGARLGQVDEFYIRPIALHYGETRLWPGDPKWYIEAENSQLGQVGMFALDCLNGFDI